MRDLRARCDVGRGADARVAAALPDRGGARAGRRAPLAATTTHLREELGDVLLQVLFHSVIAEERGAFDASDVADAADHEDAGAAPASLRRRRAGAVGADEGATRGARSSTGCRRGCRRCIAPTGCRSARPASASTGRTPRGRRAKVDEELAEVRAELAALAERTASASGDTPVYDELHGQLEDELGDLLFAVRQPLPQGGRARLRSRSTGPTTSSPTASTPWRSWPANVASCSARRRWRARRALGRGEAGLGARGSCDARCSARGLHRPARSTPAAGPQPVHHARERDRLAQVRQPADPRDGALEADAEAGVDEGAVLPQVEIPAVGVLAAASPRGCAGAAGRSRPRAAMPPMISP